ncbi:MAG: PAS domain-containing protein [Spirochaetia bacterium]|nr:PAS domain-containing protein [Spirochaetia bacterium]
MKTNYKIYFFIFLTTIMVFTIDILLPLGVAAGVPYIIPILISLYLTNRRITIFLAPIFIFLTIAGFYFSPPGGIMWMVLTNRFLAFSVIIITAFLGLRLIEKDEEIKKIASIPAENPHPIVRVSFEGNILYINNSAQKLFDYYKKDLKNFPMPAQWISIVKTALNDNKIIFHDYKINKRMFTFDFTPVLNYNYVNIYGKDITEQKKI